ncbi:MAG: DUF2828 family protein [Chitinophagales bacterium]
MKNQFLTAVYQYDTYTENGAVSHSTTGSELLNYFSKSGTFRDRKLKEVFADMGKIWAESPKIALQIIFYNRLISRKVKGFVESEKVQKGQGNRSEFRKGITWLARYHKQHLYPNLWLIPVVGSWKDLWHRELIGELDHKQVYALLKKGIEDEYNKDLIAKYLPRIRSKSNTFNDRHKALNKFAYGFLKYMNWTPTDYRKFKAEGKAHEFQRKMCDNKWNEINFLKIPGKALFSLVNKKGKDGQTSFERHDIEEAYVEWIKQQPTAKFTGYVYELMNQVTQKLSLAQKITLDKQFDGLIELAKADNQGIQENVWCALDTSGSMAAKVADTTAFNICISLGVYFATLNEGAFKDHVIMFDSESKVKQLSGTFTDKVLQITSANTAWGTTNFQSVIDEIVRVRQQNPKIPVADFPTTLIVVSDMQFNPVNGNTQTNYEAAMQKLAQVRLPRMRIVWWWVTGRGGDFPNKLDDKGVIMIGGFDGSILSLLIGGEQEQVEKGQAKTAVNQTPIEAMLKALNQDVLKKISLQ